MNKYIDQNTSVDAAFLRLEVEELEKKVLRSSAVLRNILNAARCYICGDNICDGISDAAWAIEEVYGQNELVHEACYAKHEEPGEAEIWKAQQLRHQQDEQAPSTENTYARVASRFNPHGITDRPTYEPYEGISRATPDGARSGSDDSDDPRYREIPFIGNNDVTIRVTTPVKDALKILVNNGGPLPETDELVSVDKISKALKDREHL